MLGPSLFRRLLALAVPLVTLLLIVPMAAQGAAQSPAARAMSRSRVIPVWAYLNGAYPVWGGRVVIVAGGKTVRQLGARASRRTNANGVALVSVRRVPRRFTVIVQGGRAAGRRLPGSLRSLIESGADVGVVDVNPLTALVTDVRRERPRLGFGQASRAVKRYFGVPWWADLGQNLRDGPHWFSAPAYLRSAARYGSIDRLNRTVARRILRGGSHLPRAAYQSAVERMSRPVEAMVTSTGSRELKAAGQRVREVFKNLLSTAVEIGKQGLVGGALGGLLELAKSGGIDLAGKSEIDGVREQLDALAAQITQLQGQVSKLDQHLANNHASVLIHHSDAVIGDIKTATEQFEALAKAGGTADQRRNLADAITKYIGDNLLSAPATLDLHLNPEVALGDNAIKATSRALAASSRFFDARQSDEVRAVYDYFATYQTQLAVLLTNYWNAHPGTFSVDYKTNAIGKLETSVTETQQKSLKPTVPAGAFFDTRTPQFMWAMYNHTVTGLDLMDRGWQTSKSIVVGNFRNFQLPSSHDLRKLVDGASGDPRAWLQAQVGVNLSHQLLWVSDPFRRGSQKGRCRLQITIFDLLTAKLVDWRFHAASGFVGCDLNNAGTRETLRSTYYGGMLALRYLAPGESYWW